jgi:outer membrane protein OmpA-like peptidoglycan-associated protein
LQPHHKKKFMSFNLFQSAAGLFNNQAVQAIAGQFNESENTITKALSGVIPGIIGGLASKAEAPGGTSAIDHLVKDTHAQFEDADLGALLGNSSLMSSGWEMVKGLFGSQSDNLLGKLASFSGGKVSTITSLLGVGLPMVMKLLRGHAKSNDLSAGGLASLLSSQKASVLSSLPAGLDLSSVYDNAFPKAVVADVKAEEPAAPGNKWLWPLIILLLLAALLWWWFNRSKTAETTTAPVVADTVVTATTTTLVDPATLGKLDTATGNFMYNLGSLKEIKLSDGTVFKVGENSSEARLFNFLNDNNVSVDTVDKTKGWISLDRVYFETGKNTLTAQSTEQLKNIAAILKAFPNSNIKFGGYTDNTGAEDANMTLSGNRAAAALAAVVGMGVDAGRAASEGYGPMHPIATNETAEGRALNRRVDVRVTKK